MVTTWTGTIDSDASNNGNWTNNAPTSTSGAIFDGTSAVNCTFNISGVIEYFDIDSTYLATVTLANNLTIGTQVSPKNIIEGYKLDLDGHTLTLEADTDIGGYSTRFQNAGSVLDIGQFDITVTITTPTPGLTFRLNELRLTSGGKMDFAGSAAPLYVEVNTLTMTGITSIIINTSATYIKVTGTGLEGMSITGTGDGCTIGTSTTDVTWSLWFTAGGISTIHNLNLQGAAISFKDTHTASFEDSTLTIEEFIDLDGVPILSFQNCVLQSNDEQDWFFRNWTDPATVVDFIDSYCEDFTNSVHYSSTGSKTVYDSRLDFSEGIHKYKTIPNTKVAKHDIQGSLTARRYPISKERMVEIGVYLAIDSTDLSKTFKDMYYNRAQFALTYYDEILNKCIILEEPLLNYKNAHYRELRVLLGEML